MSNNFQALFTLEIFDRLLVPDRRIAPHATGEKVDRSKSMQDRNATVDMTSKLKSASNFIEYTLKFQFWDTFNRVLLGFVVLSSELNLRYPVPDSTFFRHFIPGNVGNIVRVSHRYNSVFAPVQDTNLYISRHLPSSIVHLRYY